jgi:hypothetical protein
LRILSSSTPPSAGICLRVLQLGAPAIALQALLWVVHTSLLRSVTDDSPPALNATPINRSTDDPQDRRKLLSPHITLGVIDNFFQIQASNTMNDRSHPFMSRPIDWPFLTDVRVAFWPEGGATWTAWGISL